jgi:sugar phosphate isomerase/epimerase
VKTRKKLKSYKNTFPFKIGTTSYIYPDHILPNVKSIGSFVDEIELLLYESARDSLPDPKEIRELLALSHEYHTTYNVHLPIDVQLGSRDTSERTRAVACLTHIFDLVSPLTPTTHTLHLAYDESTGCIEDLKRWQENTYESMGKLLSNGMPTHSISIETLNYPLKWTEDIIDEFHLSVCIDVGHLLRRGVNPAHVYASYGESVTIIHLHAWDGQRDHMPLDKLSETDWRTVMDLLTRFRGVVSLEVFSFDHLSISLALLENRLVRP